MGGFLHWPTDFSTALVKDKHVRQSLQGGATSLLDFVVLKCLHSGKNVISGVIP